MMFYPIILTIILFFIVLGFQYIFKNICAICFAFAGTWIIFVIANLFFEIPIDPTILGIYMGSSAVGFMYYLSSKLPEKFYILKLPFLISLIFFAYSFLKSSLDKTTLLIIILMWFVFLFMFTFRNFFAFKKLIKKIVECCRNW